LDEDSPVSDLSGFKSYDSRFLSSRVFLHQSKSHVAVDYTHSTATTYARECSLHRYQPFTFHDYLSPIRVSSADEMVADC
jgi:hypothetical protein